MIYIKANKRKLLSWTGLCRSSFVAENIKIPTIQGVNWLERIKNDPLDFGFRFAEKA